jgi:ankyrin repeat protein
MDPIKKLPHFYEEESGKDSSLSNTDAKTSQVGLTKTASHPRIPPPPLPGKVLKEVANPDVVMRVEAATKPTLLPSAENPEKFHIGLKIGFFCDVDCPDDNGAVLRGAINSIENGVPFITTRSLLSGSNIGDLDKSSYYRKALEKLLIQSDTEWNIFEQIDPDGGEGFLVFIPKSLGPDKSPLETLENFDFRADSLKPIPKEALFQESKKRGPTIGGFSKLFRENPKINKIFDLTGHGDQSMIGSLSLIHYKEFTKFLDTQKCKGLIIKSCSAGGESSLYNIPEKNTPHPFLILTRSIGDFEAFTNQKAEKNLSLFYDEFAKFLEESPQTIDSLRKTIDKIEGSDEKVPGNLLQAYFPHSPNIPGGFRPVTEHQTAFSLTYAKVKQAEIEGKRSDCPPQILVQNKNFIEIQTLTTPIEIQYSEKTPTLLSQVPGHSNHFIATITSKDDSSPDTFIQNTVNFYKKNKPTARKAFFIESLNAQENSYKKVVILINLEITQYSYESNGKYFLFNGLETKEITAFQHEMFCEVAKKSTYPKESAVRAATAGQDHVSLFLEAIERSSFSDLKKSRNKSINSFSTLADIPSNLSKEEQETFLFYILNVNSNLAMQFFENKEIDPNIKNFSGVPLCSALFSRNSMKLLDMVIKKGADLNATNRQGVTILGLAIQRNDKNTVKYLLDQGADPNIGTPHPFMAALSTGSSEIIALLMDKNARCPQVFNPEEEKMLSGYLKYLISYNDHESIKNLLKWSNSSSPFIALYTITLLSNIDQSFLQELARENLIPLPPFDNFLSGNFINFNMLKFFVKNRLVTLSAITNVLNIPKTRIKFLNDLFEGGPINLPLQELAEKGLLNNNPCLLAQLILNGIVTPTESILQTIYTSGNAEAIEYLSQHFRNQTQ